MTEFIRKRTANAKNDILSGLTVALALVPEAVAFAFVAGVDPLVGLYAAFMIGLITSIFGGRPGMISGATGALAVVMVSLVAEGNAMGAEGEQLGLYYLFATVVLMGIIQMLAGVFKLGKFVRLIPHPVMMGFVNGLAIVIFLSQLGMFMTYEDGKEVWMHGPKLWTMIGLVALTMGIMFGLPKVTKKLPEALIAILVVSAIVIFGNLDVATVGSFIRDGGGEGLKGGLPSFQTDIFNKVPFTWETLKFIGPYALILAAIGLIESLMTLNLIDELTETRGNTNRECLAQGGANIVTGLFGGMGGCAMIGQSIINIKGGGRTRLSGIVAALALLGFILFASGLIEQVPIAALVGVMFMVVIGTFAWSSFRIMNKIPKTDLFVLILVSGLTVVFDLAIAVIAGVIVSALVFSWENAKRIRARKRFKDDGTKVYEIWGPLFFGSIKAFNDKFDAKNDPDKVEIDFVESRVSDHSALEAIFNIVAKYEAEGKTIKLKHLSEDCKALMYKASPKFREVIIEAIDDPRYHLAANPEDFPKPLSEYKL
ncbi:MAG: sodium-independent anion transporter [Xanthomarina sp.]|uniref:SulP family inorganic anion transporter n=1 Tax=Xanthomarina TaxID=1868329 RepID=UPI000C4984C9|nr:SulP family inorganic anion transporter [Xanthomarina sp.]MAL23688.1 sodium-independent anion transporter [Xanthomarina sp.]MBF60490.1 sodium-independent anion transporter [Xanthomarina sp.]HAB27764.1 sodium-independent anion transporter [Xanthomarina gelatinilytica]|tara:strand:+ start:122 stop:1744 length:1623 start_codon:yes stop_codon:yes gene_type:complete